MAEPTPTSTSKGPPQLEEGEIGEADKDSQSVKPANKTYSIHDNPLINDQPENEPRVYASAKARKVMARAQRLALIARQSKEPRQPDSHNAHEGRARSEPREFNRPNQPRRRHSGRRRGDNLPLHRRTRARTDFPAGADENRNENFDQPSNHAFTDYSKRERERHHHVPPHLDHPNDQQANDTNMPYNQPDHHYDPPVHHYDHALNHRYDHPEAYHEQPPQSQYPAQSSSQPPPPPTPHHHHLHPPKLVPNYPPSHYLSYPPPPPPPLPPPPTQASSFPLQSIPEHEAISHPPFREYEVTYGPPMQAQQAHIPAPPPEAYFPPQAHHEPPVSQHVISSNDVHAENQSSHSEYDSQQQHHVTYQLSSEQQMSREHYPHHHPRPMVENQLVPNYPVPPTYDEFQHPPQSSPTLHGFHPRPPSRSEASNPEIHGANQPPYYQGDPEQQRQHVFETASEQLPQAYSSGPTHPQPFGRARLVPNYPAPADQREFRHPPPFSPSAPGSEALQPPPLPIPRPPSAPLLDRQRYPAHHHYNPDSRQLRGASEAAPSKAGAFPVDAYHHRSQPQGAPPRPDQPAPVTPRHPEQARFPPRTSGNIDRRPTDMDNGGEEQWASKEEEYQSKLKEANALMAEVISMGITVEFLRSIGISERLVRGAYPATYAELEAGGSGSHLAHNNGEK